MRNCAERAHPHECASDTSHVGQLIRTWACQRAGRPSRRDFANVSTHVPQSTLCRRLSLNGSARCRGGMSSRSTVVGWGSGLLRPGIGWKTDDLVMMMVAKR